MNYSIDDFYGDIEDCLELAYKELKDRKNDIDGESSLEQLENYIIPELEKLLIKINNKESLPPNTHKDRYISSFGSAFKVWGWDIMNPTKFYIKLLELNKNYKKL